MGAAHAHNPGARRGRDGPPGAAIHAGRRRGSRRLHRHHRHRLDRLLQRLRRLQPVGLAGVAQHRQRDRQHVPARGDRPGRRLAGAVDPLPRRLARALHLPRLFDRPQPKRGAAVRLRGDLRAHRLRPARAAVRLERRRRHQRLLLLMDRRAPLHAPGLGQHRRQRRADRTIAAGRDPLHGDPDGDPDQRDVGWHHDPRGECRHRGGGGGQRDRDHQRRRAQCRLQGGRQLQRSALLAGQHQCHGGRAGSDPDRRDHVHQLRLHPDQRVRRGERAERRQRHGAAQRERHDDGHDPDDDPDRRQRRVRGHHEADLSGRHRRPGQRFPLRGRDSPRPGRLRRHTHRRAAGGGAGVDRLRSAAERSALHPGAAQRHHGRRLGQSPVLLGAEPAARLAGGLPPGHR